MKFNIAKIAVLVVLAAALTGCELYLGGWCLGTECGCPQSLPYCPA